MTKIIAIPSKKDINDILEYADAFLFGIENLSVNTFCDVSLEEIYNINEIIKDNNKELFISLNKNIRNEEINVLKEILVKLDNLNINGIFYADPCFIKLKKDLNLKTPLVWSNEHLTTNYATINFYKKHEVEYTYLSGELTKEEILEIRENTTNKLIVPIFGHLPMYVSFRHAVKNYLEKFNLKDNSKINYIFKEGKIYPIIDNNMGVTVFSSYILDGYEEYLEFKKHNIDYVTISSFNLENNEFIKILDKYKNNTNYNIEKNTDKGFLYKETVYKVK